MSQSQKTVKVAPLPPYGSVATSEQQYLTLRTRRGMWFSSVSKNPDSSVIGFMGSGSVDCPFPQPRIRGNVREDGTVVLSNDRAASVLQEAVHAARECIRDGRGSGPDNGITVWMPFSLTKGEMHALAMLIRVPAEGPVSVTVFEPHGSDPAHVGHRGGSWANFYRAASFESEVAELIAAGIPGAEVVMPRDYLPAVFGQSTSEVLGDGVGDRWCVLWTLLFLVFCTVNGTKEQFVELVEAKRNAGTLGRWLQLCLASVKSWVVSPPAPLPTNDPPFTAAQLEAVAEATAASKPPVQAGIAFLHKKPGSGPSSASSAASASAAKVSASPSKSPKRESASSSSSSSLLPASPRRPVPAAAPARQVQAMPASASASAASAMATITPKRPPPRDRSAASSFSVAALPSPAGLARQRSPMVAAPSPLAEPRSGTKRRRGDGDSGSDSGSSAPSQATAELRELSDGEASLGASQATLTAEAQSSLPAWLTFGDDGGPSASQSSASSGTARGAAYSLVAPLASSFAAGLALMAGGRR